MEVSLEKFLRRLTFELGLIRANKGPSIVPLAIINFQGIYTDDGYWSPWHGVFLATVSQQHGGIYLNKDLSKRYSASSAMHGNYELLSIRPHNPFCRDRLLRIEAKYIDFTWIE